MTPSAETGTVETGVTDESDVVLEAILPSLATGRGFMLSITGVTDVGDVASGDGLFACPVDRQPGVAKMKTKTAA
jgi:hypothetical protein